MKLLPEPQPQCVFGGGMQSIRSAWRNKTDQPVKSIVRWRLHQATSATTAFSGDILWKQLQVLSGQTVVESAVIAFPAVEAETKFLIQWLGDGGHVLGVTEVLVYPTNLLAQFKTLAGGEPLGVFDPGHELKPLLRTQSVEFQDLVEDGTDKFHGKLAVFGPFASKQQMRENLADDIRALAKRGVAVVWLQPHSKPHAPLKPSFYTVRANAAAVVVAQAGMVLRLADNPEAQLNLIRLAELALRPEPLDLPESQNPN
jgi:hypothetical protein